MRSRPEADACEDVVDNVTEGVSVGVCDGESSTPTFVGSMAINDTMFMELIVADSEALVEWVTEEVDVEDNAMETGGSQHVRKTLEGMSIADVLPL